jgi:hypothetical protein
MRLPLVQSVVAGLLAGILAGCTGQYAIKPAEVLDERTGVTVGALQQPIELVASVQNAVPVNGARASFAYLGPVEWDRSGDISYGLWIHVAPGNDRQVADIRSKGAVTLLLDGGPLELSPMDTPYPVSGPYQPVASWGQTAYFGIDTATLKRIAASAALTLEFRGATGPVVDFTPTHETRTTLSKFLAARGITDD